MPQPSPRDEILTNPKCDRERDSHALFLAVIAAGCYSRAIVRVPRVFLFDEPLSNLDAALPVQMRIEIARLQKMLKTTTVYVTHDQVEAMTLADKIVVLNAGRVEQVGIPMELYHTPANTFVAGFIGSPSMNLMPCLVEGESTSGVTLKL